MCLQRKNNMPKFAPKEDYLLNSPFRANFGK